ncbi:MAG: MFS transporter [Candidatus Sumerlaeota bacterium]|nr:MFS transporter [Candidatus Sumerlaeota bacterium]
MIVTQRKRVPWLWVVLMAVPFFSDTFVEQCTLQALPFTLKKFISNPALITFVGSFNILFNFLVGPFVAYKSDRIWTRFGRRKPFIIGGWIGLASALVFTPFAPNFWVLVVVVVVYLFFQDLAFSGPYNPLFYEVVPLPQRGRAAAFNVFMQNIAGLFFSAFFIGHFDEVFHLGLGLSWLHVPVSVTGEQVIYFTASAIVVGMLLLIGLNVKETEVESPLLGERFSLRIFLKSVFGEKQWVLIYFLIFSQIVLNQGLNQLGPLLITEQFGFSKQMLGYMGFISGMLRILVAIPIAGIFADKVDRVRIFQVVLILATLHHMIYWTFIHFFAPHPTFWVVVGFDIAGTFINATGNIAVWPLFFDFVPRDQMGTVTAGMGFVRGIVKIVVMNFVGVWIALYSKFLMPPGTYDYMSGFLCTSLLGVLGCAASFYFMAERKKGRVVEYGRLEQEGPSPSAETE